MKKNKNNTHTFDTPSISEWMKLAGIKNIEQFRLEDNTKRQRLAFLHKTINLPYLESEKISIGDIIDKNVKYQNLLTLGKNKEFLFKLLPINLDLPKIRSTKMNIKDIYTWLISKKINPKEYKLEVVTVPGNSQMSAIFCVNKKGVWGEVIKGSIWQFSHGVYKKTSIVFFYNFERWFFTRRDLSVENFVKKAVKKIMVNDSEKKRKIKEKLTASFAGGGKYFEGYFECTLNPQGIIHFVDFNRKLYKILNKSIVTISHNLNCLHGVCLGPGKTTGTAFVMNGKKNHSIKDGEILVCSNASFEYLPLIKKAGGIISEQGAILSHAAIICRELKKPFVAHVKHATKNIKTGDIVQINADIGFVKIIKKLNK